MSNAKDNSMRTMLLAAAAVLSLGVGAAYADSGGGEDGGVIPNTFFSELPGVDTQQGQQPNDVAANAPVMQSNSAAMIAAPRATPNNGS
jgi:hypothetical protein